MTLTTLTTVLKDSYDVKDACGNSALQVCFPPGRKSGSTLRTGRTPTMFTTQMWKNSVLPAVFQLETNGSSTLENPQGHPGRNGKHG